MQAKVSGALTHLAHELAALSGAGDPNGLSGELRNQLASLAALQQNLASADEGTLAQMRAEVSAVVAASTNAAQAAQVAIDAGGAGSAAQAAYIKATAELDGRMSVLRAADKKRDDDAHDMAGRYGVDLKDYDKERAELERERAAAIARGDKVGEDQANVLLLHNTENASKAVDAGITDPAEKKRYDQAVADAQKATDAGEAVLASRLELQGRAVAADQGLTGNDADAYVARYKADKIAETNEHASQLVGSSSEQTASAAFTAERQAILAENVPSAQNKSVHEALTPEARTATQQAVAAISSSFGSFAANLSMDGTSQIALSTAPDAHSTVEVPVTKIAATSTSQTRA